MVYAALLRAFWDGFRPLALRPLEHQRRSVGLMSYAPAAATANRRAGTRGAPGPFLPGRPRASGGDPPPGRARPAGSCVPGAGRHRGLRCRCAMRTLRTAYRARAGRPQAHQRKLGPRELPAINPAAAADCPPSCFSETLMALEHIFKPFFEEHVARFRQAIDQICGRCVRPKTILVSLQNFIPRPKGPWQLRVLGCLDGFSRNGV